MYDGFQGNSCVAGMTCAQGTMWGVVHDEKRSATGRLDAKIEDRDNVGMSEPHIACFVEEGWNFFRCESDVKDFDGNLRLSIDVLCQVDIAELPSPQEADEAVSIDLLAGAVCHSGWSFSDVKSIATCLMSQFHSARSLVDELLVGIH